MARNPIPAPTADVIDLTARRRCALERAGHDELSVAVHLFAETGDVPSWDITTGDDYDGSEWAA